MLKRIKNILISILILMSLTACSTSNNKSNTKTTASVTGETTTSTITPGTIPVTAVEQKSTSLIGDPSSSVKDEYEYTKIKLQPHKIIQLNTKFTDGFNIFKSVFANNDTILICAEKNRNTFEDLAPQIKFYKYSLSTQTTEEVLEKNDFLDKSGDIIMKVLINGDVVAVSATKLLLFDKKTLKLKKETIKIKPTEIYFMDISPLGNQLAFIEEDGLYLSDIDGYNTKAIAKRDLKDTETTFFQNPVWSNDGKKILYTKAVEESETTLGFGTINSDGTNNKFFGTSEFCGYGGVAWFNDNENIIIELFETGLSKDGKCFNLKTQKMNTIFMADNAEISSRDSSPIGSKFAYRYSKQMTDDDTNFYISIVNTELSTKYSFDFNNAIMGRSGCWSPSGNKYAFTANVDGKIVKLFYVQVD